MKNKKVWIAVIVVVVVGAAILLYLTMPRQLTVENQMFYLGEASLPEFSAEGLNNSEIESIEYSFDQEGIFTITNENKLLPEKDIDDPVLCTINVKTDGRSYKGEFYASVTYKTVEINNGDMPLGKKTGPCPLKITNAEIGQKCYVYFKNNGSGDDYSIMVDGEKSIDRKVPTGSYTMYVAYGYVTQDWYGTKYLFGMDGNSYYKRDEALEFTSTSRRIGGYTMTLLDGTGGQVNLKQIPYSEFPGTEG